MRRQRRAARVIGAVALALGEREEERHVGVADEAHAARLRAEGIDVTELHYEGQVHGFLAINGEFRDSVDLTRRVGAAIRDTFHESERRFG